MTEGATHPDDGDMLRLLDGACEPEERRALAAHLDGCPACAARAEALERRAARLARLLGYADQPAPRAEFPAARLARARSRRAALRWRAAAVAALALSGALAVRPVRAWIVEAARAILALPLGSPRDSGRPAPIPAVASSDTAGAVVFEPAAGVFMVRVASRQAAGALVLELGDGPTARAVVVGDRAQAELLVLPDGLRIDNRPDAEASYLVRVPSAARVVVRVGSETQQTIRLGAGGSRQVVDLGPPRQR